MDFFKRYLPQITAIILFVIVAALFFSPLFDDKQIRQSDNMQYRGAAKEIEDYRAKTGEEPLWTNSMFGGMPAYQISIKYPGNKVQLVQNFFSAVFPFPATVILLSIVGFYFLLITLNVDKWVSISGAIAFGLSSFIVIVLAAGHNTQAYAIAYMPPVLMGVLLTTRGRLFLGGALTALALALELYSNHLQMTYYLMMLVIILGIGEAVRLVMEKKTKYLMQAAGILAAAAIIAVLPNLNNLVLTNEYAKDTTRGKSELTIDNQQNEKTGGLPFEYATQWSYGKGETMTLMIPNFNGGASDPIAKYDPDALEGIDNPAVKNFVGQAGYSYFGGVSFTSGPVYVGAIICFLFVLGLFIVKDQIKWYLLGATLLSIMLAWGSNAPGISKFFFYHVPGYNKFRSVEFILIIAELAIPILAMLALREIIKNAAILREKMMFFWIAFALTGGICLLVWLSPTTFVSPMSEKQKARIEQMVDQYGPQAKLQPSQKDDVVEGVREARIEIVKSDAIRSFLFILLAAALVFFYIRKPFNVIWLAAGMTVLMLIDMYGVSKRYFTDDNYEPAKEKSTTFTKTASDARILQDKDPDYRVLNLTVDPWQDATTSYWHKSIGGYHGAKLKRTQELYEQVLEENIQTLNGALQHVNAELSDSMMMQEFMATGVTPSLNAALAKTPGLNMLNTKYIILNEDGFVVRNPHACGSAWFVKDLKWVKNADEEITTVKTIDPQMTAIADERFKDVAGEFTPKYDPAATIRLTSYAPNDLKYESNASADQLAVFSEIFYDEGKGWNAYIDNQPVKHMRVDYVLRAMRVPSGHHNIEFKFEPSFYYKGEKIELTGSLLLFLFIGGGIFMEWKKKRDNAKKTAA